MSIIGNNIYTFSQCYFEWLRVYFLLLSSVLSSKYKFESFSVNCKPNQNWTLTFLKLDLPLQIRKIEIKIKMLLNVFILLDTCIYVGASIDTQISSLALLLYIIRFEVHTWFQFVHYQFAWINVKVRILVKVEAVYKNILCNKKVYFLACIIASLKEVYKFKIKIISFW